MTFSINYNQLGLTELQQLGGADLKQKNKDKEDYENGLSLHELQLIDENKDGCITEEEFNKKMKSETKKNKQEVANLWQKYVNASIEKNTDMALNQAQDSFFDSLSTLTGKKYTTKQKNAIRNLLFTHIPNGISFKDEDKNKSNHIDKILSLITLDTDEETDKKLKNALKNLFTKIAGTDKTLKSNDIGDTALAMALISGSDASKITVDNVISLKNAIRSGDKYVNNSINSIYTRVNTALKSIGTKFSEASIKSIIASADVFKPKNNNISSDDTNQISESILQSKILKDYAPKLSSYQAEADGAEGKEDTSATVDCTVERRDNNVVRITVNNVDELMTAPGNREFKSEQEREDFFANKKLNVMSYRDCYLDEQGNVTKVITYNSEGNPIKIFNYEYTPDKTLVDKQWTYYYLDGNSDTIVNNSRATIEDLDKSIQNNMFGAYPTQTTGDCYLMAAINSLTMSNEGMEQLNDLFTIDNNGNYVVTLKGAQEFFNDINDDANIKQPSQKLYEIFNIFSEEEKTIQNPEKIVQMLNDVFSTQDSINVSELKTKLEQYGLEETALDNAVAMLTNLAGSDNELKLTDIGVAGTVQSIYNYSTNKTSIKLDDIKALKETLQAKSSNKYKTDKSSLYNTEFKDGKKISDVFKLKDKATTFNQILGRAEYETNNSIYGTNDQQAFGLTILNNAVNPEIYTGVYTFTPDEVEALLDKQNNKYAFGNAKVVLLEAAYEKCRTQVRDLYDMNGVNSMTGYDYMATKMGQNIKILGSGGSSACAQQVLIGRTENRVKAGLTTETNYCVSNFREMTVIPRNNCEDVYNRTQEENQRMNNMFIEMYQNQGYFSGVAEFKTLAGEHAVTIESIEITNWDDVIHNGAEPEGNIQLRNSNYPDNPSAKMSLSDFKKAAIAFSYTIDESRNQINEAKKNFDEVLDAFADGQNLKQEIKQAMIEVLAENQYINNANQYSSAFRKLAARVGEKTTLTSGELKLVEEIFTKLSNDGKLVMTDIGSSTVALPILKNLKNSCSNLQISSENMNKVMTELTKNNSISNQNKAKNILKALNIPVNDKNCQIIIKLLEASEFNVTDDIKGVNTNNIDINNKLHNSELQALGDTALNSTLNRIEQYKIEQDKIEQDKIEQDKIYNEMNLLMNENKSEIQNYYAKKNTDIGKNRAAAYLILKNIPGIKITSENLETVKNILANNNNFNTITNKINEKLGININSNTITNILTVLKKYF